MEDRETLREEEQESERKRWGCEEDREKNVGETQTGLKIKIRQIERDDVKKMESYNRIDI